jgi:very-short-patch-repair endonuclease
MHLSGAFRYRLVIHNHPRHPQFAGSAVAAAVGSAEDSCVHPASRRQAGILTRQQALAAGVTARMIQCNVQRGRWRAVHRAVYATFDGPIPRTGALWAAVLAAGRDATLSHHTAAELWNIADERSAAVHVTIPADRRIGPLHGIVVHHSSRLGLARHPTLRPFRTRVEETVLDLADLAVSVDAAIAWCTAAVERRLTTVSRLSEVLDDRRRSRWRPELTVALGDVGSGAVSPLELRYLRDVERDHGLPRAARQVRHARCGGSIYDDVNYAGFGLVVELDGRVAHPARSRLRDLIRDNVTAERGDSVLHYGWSDVVDQPCAVAAQVGRVLAVRGWTGVPKRCRRESCVIQ